MQMRKNRGPLRAENDDRPIVLTDLAQRRYEAEIQAAFERGLEEIAAYAGFIKELPLGSPPALRALAVLPMWVHTATMDAALMARDEGATWAEIGDCLGLSAKEAARKYNAYWRQMRLMAQEEEDSTAVRTANPDQSPI